MGLFFEEKVPEKAPPPPSQDAITVIVAFICGTVLAIFTFILKMLSEILTPVAKGTGTWLANFEGLTAEQRTRKKKLNTVIFVVIVFFIYKALAGLNLLPARYVVTEGDKLVSSAATTQSYPSNQTSVSNEEGVVSVQLSYGMPPIMPLDESFTVESGDTWSYFFMNHLKEEDQRMYIRYGQSADGSVPIRLVEQGLCQIVPAGKEIIFVTKYPPQYVVNMSNDVQYHVNEEWLNYFEQVELWVLNRGSYKKFTSVSRTRSWNDAYMYWGHIDAMTYGIRGKALEKSQIPGGKHGGLVCF